MDRNFYNNDDFEEFLKQKADQYKMYPSDRVWNNIYNSLHSRRKWVAVAFTLLFITSSLFIGRQAVISNYNRMATQMNKGPETLFSTNKNSGTRDQYKLTTRVKPTANSNITVYPVAIEKPSVKNNTLPAVTLSADFDKAADKVTVTNATEGSLVIENNLLPAVPGAPVHPGLNSTVAAADEKQPGLHKNMTEKTAPLKEINTGAAIQNDLATIKPVKPSKWFLQFYASPIISYRRLSNDNQPGYTAPVSATYAGNINKYVQHKPAPGLEVGGKIQYKLSNSLSLYAGAQLNYSRYYIDAYKYRIEKASIALNDSHPHDTLSGYTDIRNFSGYAPEQLQNQYWQLSVPLGIEVKLLGEKNSYLISSDYKNYIQSPDLARSFNVHTNFEAFISYQAGGIKWQLGPQFRSQLLSSYSNQYRVREYLTEFGIKFGITKTLR